ncbi:MAG TPA: hypothetical protein DHM90_01610 [Clostridiaceae bacterium]|nr:hypothetical protein [Clostridiaceae bacterium]
MCARGTRRSEAGRGICPRRIIMVIPFHSKYIKKRASALFLIYQAYYGNELRTIYLQVPILGISLEKGMEFKQDLYYD